MKYHSRLIDSHDLSKLQKMLEKCNDYFNLVYKRDSNISDSTGIFNEIPDNKSIEDKFLIGIFNDNKDIIGVIDIIKDYPELNTWYLGLMLIDPDYRNSSLGRSVFDDTEEWSIDLGAKKIRLGVVEQNNKGLNFWTKVGFKSIKTVEKTLESVKSKIIIMEKVLIGNL